MQIEIHGAGFINKGAQLMLLTVRDKLHEFFPNCQLCVAVSRSLPTQSVHQEGLGLLWPTAMLGKRSRGFGIRFPVSNILQELVPSRVYKPYGLEVRKNVDALVDISGFAFGDVWGSRKMHKFTRLAQYYKRRNKPVVLLPQMFGSFQKAESKKAIVRLIESCDLVYARDNASFRQLNEECSGSGQKIGLAPDITIFAKPDSKYRIPAEEYICIIPNIRVLDSGSTDWGEDDYLSTLAEIGKSAIEFGINVRAVVHEQFGKDAVLAQKLLALLQLPEDCLVVKDNPLELKAILSNAAFNVGSRYHSLVSSLSSHTPTLAIGWAHKYPELFSDFGVREFCIKDRKEKTSLMTLARKLMKPSFREEVRLIIANKMPKMTDSNQEMWQRVRDTIINGRST